MKKHGPFDDIEIEVLGNGARIEISEGTGDNLLREDIEAGYKDYVNYKVYGSDGSEDGGMVLYTELIQKKFKSIKEVIPDVLEDFFGDRNLQYLIRYI